jgi:putative oxidoreductase
LKIVSWIARILLGLVFVVFGLNPFLKFIPMQMPQGLAGQYLMVLFQSHIVYVVGAVQVIGGLLLFINRYVPLGLTFLGPVIVNILCYHIFIDRAGIPLAAIVTVLWFILFFRYRESFAGILGTQAPVQPA